MFDVRSSLASSAAAMLVSGYTVRPQVRQNAGTSDAPGTWRTCVGKNDGTQRTRAGGSMNIAAPRLDVPGWDRQPSSVEGVGTSFTASGGSTSAFGRDTLGGGHQQAADVQEYFDKVINGISHKWDDLARKLGFNENKINGIRTDQPDQDHRCREVLNRWRNREGRGATLQVLKQALIDIDERATAESLEELQEPQPSTSKLKKTEKHLEQTPGEKSKKPRTESDSEDGESHEEESPTDPDREASGREITPHLKVLKLGEDMFHPDNVTNPDKFERAVGLFRERAKEMLGTDMYGSGTAYRDGRLSDTLTRELITDDMRAAEGEDLYVHVTLLGEEEENPIGPTGKSQVESSTSGFSDVFIKQEPLSPVKVALSTGLPLHSYSEESSHTVLMESVAEGEHKQGHMKSELQELQPSTSKLKRKEKHLEQTPGEKSKKPRTDSESEDGESHEEGSPRASSSQRKRKRKFPVKNRPAASKQSGVRKYFYYTKEKVSSDWKDLAFHLGFEQPDIDNMEGRNRDDKSRCMDLLEEWLKGNGERATIEVLMEALSEAGLQSVLDGLRNEFQSLAKVPVPARAAGVSTSVTDLFQKSVKKHYELKLTHFKPLIWNDNFTLSLTDIFTQLELIPTSEKNKRSESMTEEQRKRKELKSLDDLFKPDVTGLSTAPRCILIEGEAGGGKTTFLSKEALDAVSQKTELGRRHDIVLLIRLREVREGETIEEMVWDQCVPERKDLNVKYIEAILERNESCVLFLLDGYDELRPEARAAGQAIPKLLSGKMYPNSTIVITSRPSSAGVQQYTRPDCHIHIMGFSPEHAAKYVKKYFSITESPELGKDFIKQYFIVSHDDDEEKVENTVWLKNNELLKNLIQTPMFLMFVCLLWEEGQEMVSTGTMMGLYDNLLTCLVRKCCEREGVDMPTEGLPTEVAESLLQLGKLALEALLRNETLLDLTEVKREKVNWESLLKLGVVSLEVSSSKLHPRKQLNFSHKTMQEFLAGRYVAHAQVNQDIVELLQLTSISKALELSNLLQFTCGCGSRAAQAVMEELSKLSGKEFSHLRPDDFWDESHLPVKPDVKKSVETYKRFVLLCLNILNERKELGVLQAVSRTLPVIILDLPKQHAVLKYYLENIQSSNLPDRMILESSLVDTSDALQYMEQIFTSRVPGLQLDLGLNLVTFNSPDLTARLVSVLKNVPCLRALDLYNTDLTPSSLQPLVQEFRHMSLLEELDLSLNLALGDAGMEVLQVGLSSVPHLAVLHLVLVNMTAVGMLSLAPCMRHLVGLRELDISSNEIGDTGLESLTTVLHTFTAIQVLGLSATGISPTGMRTLVPTLCKLTRLIKLDISSNAIGDPGLECLAAILHHLTAMKVLVLSETGISDRGISSLIKALAHLVQLQVLDVSWNNIGDSGIVSLVQTLCQPSSLDMEQNPPGDKSLTTAPHYNTTLQELHIGYDRGVTGAGLGRIAHVISTLPALTRLNMSGHLDKPAHLSDTAAMDLAKALPRLPALEQLDLRCISMEPAGFQAVVQAAEEHPTLEMLLYSVELVPEGADTTASCLLLYG
ncbi:hypothetical protein Bbelb_097220 [Branchiostoma belcheri]|nr:hypothetical protein Bbelb_097220 [Branchiostoma belcheri]